MGQGVSVHTFYPFLTLVDQPKNGVYKKLVWPLTGPGDANVLYAAP